MTAQLRECQDCGLFQAVPDLMPGDRADCRRCHATLRKSHANSLNRALACFIGALALLTLAVQLPFLDLRSVGRTYAATIFTGPANLEAHGMWEISVVVLTTLVAVPFIQLGLILTVLIGLRLPEPPRMLPALFSWVEVLRPWSMVEVFLLGAFVAYTRLQAIATVEVGPALLALGGVMLCMTAADVELDHEDVWEALDARGLSVALPDQPQHALIGCDCCRLVVHARERSRCPRCRSRLRRRKPYSLNRCWALAGAAVALYLPANIFPILTLIRFGRGEPSTILGGVIELAQAHMWPLAILVLMASLVVPLFKLVALFTMLVMTGEGSATRLRDRTRLYRFVDSIGRWSMIDVFMLTILVALVRMGFIATVLPGGGAIAFAGVVVLTMFAAASFDPRLMWDAAAEAGHDLEEEDLESTRSPPRGAIPGGLVRVMSGSSGGEPAKIPEAVLRRRRRFSLIWLIPIVAGVIVVYLIVTTLADRGPLITISFSTGSGISAQQTQVTHKAVTLGMVEDVQLTGDMKRVLVRVRMNRQGAQLLTQNARFWVVRPRLSTGNISGLETLVSGAYIEVDPGAPGGASKRDFTGLEEPPGMRSDEPGRSFVMRASRLGSLGAGAPVFYRDVTVGEVLGYDLGSGLGPVSINVFVREPYDRFVHQNTHFWNASGLSVSLGSGGVHVELESLQALLSGGVAFETPRLRAVTPPAADNATFQLFDDKGQADAAGFTKKIPFVAYFNSSVGGLSRGSAVEVFGIQIGTVTDVSLMMDSGHGQMRVRVAYELQPERVFSDSQSEADPQSVTRGLVRQGMRAVLESSNFITGQKDISLQYVPDAPSAEVTQEGEALVMPSQSGGLDNITNSLSDIVSKLNRMPFEEIGRNLNETLAAVNRTVSGPDVKNALQKLSVTLTDVQHLVRHADQGLTPMLQRLPKISADLQAAVAHANAALGEGGYGGNSDFQRGVARVLDQVNDAARSIRLLVDFLDRHPEALLRGRTGTAGER